MKPHLITTSWDDGSRDDLRLVQLLLEYQLPATFYIPGTTKLTPEEIVQIGRHFEIGSHTLTHPLDMKLLTIEQQEDEIKGCIDYLEPLIGYRPTSYAHVRGRYDLRTIEVLKKLDVTNARTTMLNELDPGGDPYRVRATVHVYQRKEYNGESWLAYARRMLARWKKEGGTYHVFGHAWEVDRDKNWHNLELLFIDMQAAMNEVL